MGITLKGLEVAAAALMGDAYTPFNNANGYLGVGDSGAAFSESQTDLQGTNKKRKAMEVGYPTRGGRQMTWRAYFGGDDANWNWLEEAVFNAEVAGEMLAREIDDLGTKSSPAVWVLTMQGTLTVCP